MLTVDRYAEIRQLHRDGLTARQIARQWGHSPQTILKALPPRPVPRAAPACDPVRPLADAILAADEHAPGKSRHPASPIGRRRVAEYGYVGRSGQSLHLRSQVLPADHARRSPASRTG